MSKTHRCIDCPQTVECELADLCPSCGRCKKHCAVDNHEAMKPARFRLVGEGDGAKYELVPLRDYPISEN